MSIEVAKNEQKVIKEIVVFVASGTKDGVYYRVDYENDGNGWRCTCPGWAHRQYGFECKHIKEAREELENED